MFSIPAFIIRCICLYNDIFEKLLYRYHHKPVCLLFSVIQFNFCRLVLCRAAVSSYQLQVLLE